MNRTEPADIELWIEQLRILETAERCDAPQFLKPYHLATLAHTLRCARATNLYLPDKLSSYANTMNLWGGLGIEPPRYVEVRQPVGRYHPIELLIDTNLIDELSEKLVTLFRRGNVDHRTLNAIGTMLRELIGNCYAHTSVSDGVHGIICAQVWTLGGRAQIAIADNGIGIRRSLGDNPLLSSRLATENSCQLATEYGVTGKPGRGHSGYGLTVARKLLEQNKGTLFVRSLDEGFALAEGKIRTYKMLRPWPGTLLVIEWDLKNEMNIREVYDAFPLPEGLTYDDLDL
jgi:anti-sigma regulatory factor (Ser/Thr protein kinase)